jgi:hypothetical protein
MSRLPLSIFIPLGAAILVLGIGISIGLIFLEVHDQMSEDATLIVAVAFTLAIMAGATLLSFRYGWTPDPPTIIRGGRAAATDAANDPRAAVGLARGAAGRGSEHAERAGRSARSERSERPARRGSDRRRSR